MSTNAIESAYVAQLNPMEQKILQIARSHLETSFSLKKSIGFQEWQAKQQQAQQQQAKQQKAKQQQAKQQKAQEVQQEEQQAQQQQDPQEAPKPLIKRKIKIKSKPS